VDTLFTWIHLSDVQLGHGDAGHAADQRLVLEVLREDLAAFLTGEHLQPDVILVTGDIAWAGKAEQYAKAREWFREIADAVRVDASRIYVVPGNHDVCDSDDGPAADRVDLLRAGARGSSTRRWPRPVSCCSSALLATSTSPRTSPRPVATYSGWTIWTRAEAYACAWSGSTLRCCRRRTATTANCDSERLSSPRRSSGRTTTSSSSCSHIIRSPVAG
jgi:hypothetical protein